MRRKLPSPWTPLEVGVIALDVAAPDPVPGLPGPPTAAVLAHHALQEPLSVRARGSSFDPGLGSGMRSPFPGQASGGHSFARVDRPSQRPGERTSYPASRGDEPIGVGPDYAAWEPSEEGIVEACNCHDGVPVRPRGQTERLPARGPRGPRRLDNKDYAYYLVLAPTSAAGPLWIRSGWEYREDAKDASRDSGTPPAGWVHAIYTRTYLVRKGYDPKDNRYWRSLPEVVTAVSERLVAGRTSGGACVPAKKGPRGGNTTVQSLLFDRGVFERDEAVEWAVDHGYTAEKVDAPANGRHWRVRQVDPCAFKGFRTIDLTEGVKAVLGLAKDSQKGKGVGKGKGTVEALRAAPKGKATPRSKAAEPTRKPARKPTRKPTFKPVRPKKR